MADSNIDITQGSGTSVDTRTESTNGNHRQVIVIGDPATNSGVAPVDATNGVAVDNKTLPPGAATETTLSALNTKVTAVNTNSVTVSSSALPSGAATSANQTTANSSLSSIDGKITAVNTNAVVLAAGTAAVGKLAANDGVDIGDVTINNAVGSGVYIRPGTGVNLDTSAVTISAAIPSGTNTIGKISDITTSVVPGTGATNLGKAEDAAHSSGDTGVAVWGVRNDTHQDLTNTDGDYSPIAVTPSGRVQVTRAPHGIMVRGTATTTGTSDTSLIAAAGASTKNYITAIQVVNTGSTTSLITIKDGNAGSTLGYLVAPAGGGAIAYYDVPLVTSANTALYFAAGSASTTIYISAQGYKAG